MIDMYVRDYMYVIVSEPAAKPRDMVLVCLLNQVSSKMGEKEVSWWYVGVYADHERNRDHERERPGAWLRVRTYQCTCVVGSTCCSSIEVLYTSKEKKARQKEPNIYPWKM